MSLIRRAAFAVTSGLTRVAPVRAAPLHAPAVRRLATHLSHRGKSAAALALAESAVAEQRRRDGDGGTRGALSELLRVLAEHRAIASRPDEALVAADEAVRTLEREPGSAIGRRRVAPGPDHPVGHPAGNEPARRRRSRRGGRRRRTAAGLRG